VPLILDLCHLWHAHSWLMSTHAGVSARVAAEMRAEKARQQLSGQDLARIVDLPATSVARWLRGETKMSLDEASVLAEALGLTLAELLVRAEGAAALAAPSRDLTRAAEQRTARPRRQRRTTETLRETRSVAQPDRAAGFRCTSGPRRQRTGREVSRPHRRPAAAPVRRCPQFRGRTAERRSTRPGSRASTVRPIHRAVDAA
jgi:transcriptional regulator with XRE-family HTH domain